MQDLIKMFDTGEGGVSLDEILEIVHEAWNHFPHRLLNGKSPAEMLQGHHSKMLSPIQPDDLR